MGQCFILFCLWRDKDKAISHGERHKVERPLLKNGGIDAKNDINC